jgi:hypothetical protein
LPAAAQASEHIDTSERFVRQLIAKRRIAMSSSATTSGSAL